MKKLIAILTIAIVLVGAVFATSSNSSITVTTHIGNIEPSFKLSTTQVSTALGSNAAGAHEITEDALLASNQTVEFIITQINRSKSVKTYTLTATAEDLVLYKYKNAAGSDVLVSTTAHPATDAEKKFSIVGGTSGTWTVDTFTSTTAGENPTPFIPTSKVTYGGSSSGLTVTYKGNALVASEEAPVTVAKFTCEWAANNDAVTGDYQATVTLTISTT